MSQLRLNEADAAHALHHSAEDFIAKIVRIFTFVHAGNLAWGLRRAQESGAKMLTGAVIIIIINFIITIII